jgi:hypothetical protein
VEISDKMKMLLLLKREVLILYVILLLTSFCNCSFGVIPGPAIHKFHNGNIDSIINQRHFGIIKINPLQTFFCEIPVSFETFRKGNRSTQFQIGFLFPFKEHYIGKLFESMGANGTASTQGLFSYRKSPFNNHGLSFKIEFRKYGRYLYYAPQLMYKFCFYKDVTFPVFESFRTIDQTESKFSNIFGSGLIIGRQSNKHNLIFDWYAGAGLRLRSISVRILKIEDSPRPVLYPDSKEICYSFYPFINIGLRLGIKL